MPAPLRSPSLRPPRAGNVSPRRLRVRRTLPRCTAGRFPPPSRRPDRSGPTYQGPCRCLGSTTRWVRARATGSMTTRRMSPQTPSRHVTSSPMVYSDIALTLTTHAICRRLVSFAQTSGLTTRRCTRRSAGRASRRPAQKQPIVPRRWPDSYTSITVQKGGGRYNPGPASPGLCPLCVSIGAGWGDCFAVEAVVSTGRRPAWVRACDGGWCRDTSKLPCRGRQPHSSVWNRAIAPRPRRAWNARAQGAQLPLRRVARWRPSVESLRARGSPGRRCRR